MLVRNINSRAYDITSSCIFCIRNKTKKKQKAERAKPKKKTVMAELPARNKFSNTTTTKTEILYEIRKEFLSKYINVFSFFSINESMHN